MDEALLRNKVAQQALSWEGTTEGSLRHREIVAIYNSIKPAGYPEITVQSSWCAAFASVVSYKADIESIVKISASCTDLINWFNTRGQFIYGSKYRPDVGDYVFYDWESNADPDHVGICTRVSGNTYDVCEGNKDGHGQPDYVGVRQVSVGSSLVYGIGTPDYAKLATGSVKDLTDQKKYTPPKTTNWEDWMAESRKNWLRRYRFDAAIEGKDGGFTIGEYDGPMEPPLRIQFNIEKGDMTAQNNSTFRIYNLGKQHRDLLATPYCYIRFSAGYGTRLPVLTEGMVTRAVDFYDGGNMVTDVEVMDIRKTIRDTYISFSFREAVNGEDVVDRIVYEMGLSEGNCVKAPGLVWHTYDQGYAFVGAAFNALDRVCTEHGYICTILNGEINIHRKGQVITPQAVVLSAKTGLIGNPKRLIETVDGVYYLRGWQVDFMLNGAIDLGSLVKLESPFLKDGSGYFDVIQLNITGDSMGEEWKCSAKLQDPYYSETEYRITKPEGKWYENTEH